MLGLADLESEDFARGNLTVPLGLSLWMRRGRIRIENGPRRDARVAQRPAGGVGPRRAHRTGAPARVRPGRRHNQPRVYMDGLLQRAARMTAMSRVDMATRALALVSD